MSRSDDEPALRASDAELNALLEELLSRHFAFPRSVTLLDRRAFSSRSSFAMEELEVALEDGTRLSLLLKDIGPGGLLAGARRAKPSFLYDPRREIETYRMFLAGMDLGTATCYGAIADTCRGRYWLFLERVAGRELYQVGDFELWKEAARWLARFHGRCAAPAELQSKAQAAHLLIYDADYYRLWMHRAQMFGRQVKTASQSDMAALDWLGNRYEQVVEYLAKLPVTFLHGEFYASNVLVQEIERGVRICPVDWEMAAVGPALIDLAALVAGNWDDQQKAALASAYQMELIAQGRPRVGTETLTTALSYCRLHLAVQWLGWSAEWSPPPTQAQDWLAEAVTIVLELEL